MVYVNCQYKKCLEKKLFWLTHFPLVSYDWHGYIAINNVLSKCCQTCYRHLEKTCIYSTLGLSYCTKPPVQAPNLYQLNCRYKIYASTSCKPSFFLFWNEHSPREIPEEHFELYNGPKLRRRGGNLDVHRSPFTLQKLIYLFVSFFVPISLSSNF